VIRQIIEVLARIASADQTSAILAQHAGPADLHDVAILLGAVFCLAFAALVRRGRR
jgi:hypothetical protein